MTNNPVNKQHSTCGAFKAFYHFWRYMFNYKKYTSRTEFWKTKIWEYIPITILLVMGIIFTKKTSQEFVVFCLGPKISYAKYVLRTNPFIVTILAILAILYVPSLSLRARRLLDTGLKPVEAYLLVIIRPILACLVYFGMTNLFYSAIWIACIVLELMPTGMEILREMQSRFQYYASYQPNYGPLSLEYHPKAKHQYYIAPTYNYNNYYGYKNRNTRYIGPKSNTKKRLKK